MKVTPVSAIHALHIRPKPAALPETGQDRTAASQTPFEGHLVPTHVASAALNHDYHGAHAEYAAQLLAGENAHAGTRLERQRYLAQYAVAAGEETEARSYTVSLSA